MDGVERRQAFQPAKLAYVGNVRVPVAVALRENGYRQFRQNRVGDNTRDDRRRQNEKGLFRGEVELLRGMRNRLKARERPRRERDEVEHLRRRTVPRREGGLVMGNAAAGNRAEVFDDNRAAAYQNAADEDTGHDGLQPHRQFVSPDTEKAADFQRRQRQHNLPEVHFIPGNLVVEAHLKHAAEEVAEHQRQGRRVRPHDGDVDQHQKPRTQETVVVAEDIFSICERAARVGVALHQVVVVCADNQHDEAADNHAERGTQRAGNRQKGRAGHDERAPADRAPERQRPSIHWREASEQMPLLTFGYGRMIGSIHAKSHPLHTPRKLSDKSRKPHRNSRILHYTIGQNRKQAKFSGVGISNF